MNKSFLVMLLILVLLSGCAGKKPDDISEAHYKYGLKALEIVDNYLDFESTAKEAHTEMQKLIKEREGLPETDIKNPHHAKNTAVESQISTLSAQLLWLDLDRGSYDTLLEKRNDLAEKLNEKKR